ncbi:hypothetical protein KJS94_06635 [Flavihumibacter rivuli]|uniref:hypothetical protein n=1 Tax=Flavihumibacter rivuli TaxID=2838156 RepID=UPI001BDEDEF6|nr:hypothetical protein [Flavihumibacter rivuli]ULQ57873.1 hypothetical protein KJS94_06635 [Flavihumibacter rivuli]
MSCAIGSKRKTAGYYFENKEAITQVRRYYDALYKIQPFSFGFADKKFKHYTIEVTTDTIRYIYNTDQSRDEMYATILQSDYDTIVLKDMAEQMKAIKCLWVDKSSFYLDGQKETVTFLSFKSVLIDKPFVENKYYTLVFFDTLTTHPEIKARVKRGEFHQIDDKVFFTIGNRFR